MMLRLTLLVLAVFFSQGNGQPLSGSKRRYDNLRLDPVSALKLQALKLRSNQIWNIPDVPSDDASSPLFHRGQPTSSVTGNIPNFPINFINTFFVPDSSAADTLSDPSFMPNPFASLFVMPDVALASSLGGMASSAAAGVSQGKLNPKSRHSLERKYFTPAKEARSLVTPFLSPVLTFRKL